MCKVLLIYELLKYFSSKYSECNNKYINIFLYCLYSIQAAIPNIITIIINNVTAR